MTTALPFARGHELLDDPAADPARVERSLRNIARANRWFGGTAAALHGIDRVVGGSARATLLDIGTGLGDLPRAARARAHRRGLALRTFGLERHPSAVRLARGPDLPTLLACAGALPLRPHSVDVVLISQVLHHFEREAAVRLIRSAVEVARCGIVIADLRRARAAQLLFLAGSVLLGFDTDTRRDGVTSVGRGYSSVELRRVCEEAGVAASVERRPGFRLVAWWRRPERG